MIEFRTWRIRDYFFAPEMWIKIKTHMAGVTFDTQSISCCISGRPHVCKKVRQHSLERDLAQLRSLFGNVPRPMWVRDMFRAWFSERELQGRYLAKSRQLLRLRDREEEPAYSDRTRRTCEDLAISPISQDPHGSNGSGRHMGSYFYPHL